MIRTRSPLAVHWSLDPAVDFLTHGTYGATPIAILDAQATWRSRMEREPVLFMSQLDGLMDEARTVIGAFVGAPAADLAFLTNATTAVNTVLRSLELAPGDEILATDHEYNACLNAARVVAAEAGARIVVAPVPFPVDSPDDVLQAILDRVSPRTRYALVSHVTSATALVFPIERIVSELRELGIETIVDGAHAPGMVPIDLAGMGAAFYAGNGHKWLCGPKGTAFLYVRPDLRSTVRPMTISHGANAPRDERDLFRLEFDWMGTSDPTGHLALPEAIRFIGDLVPGGWPEVMARNTAMCLEGRRVVAEALGMGLPAPATMIGAMATLEVPAELAPTAAPMRARPDVTAPDDPLHAALFAEDGIEVPVGAWPPTRTARPSLRWLRISAQLYNDAEQYARLAAALRGRRKA